MAVRHHIKVMVVDDEESICNTVRSILQERGYKVSTFLDAESAIEGAREAAYDVALVDINLPRTSGVELAEKLREEGDRPAVIIITAYPDVESAAESMRSGSRDYITKPFDPEHLVAAVERVCREMGLIYTNEGDLNRLIGQRIRQERQKRGLTLRQLSERTVLTTSQLSQVELGKNAASIWALARISSALECHLFELLHDVHHLDKSLVMAVRRPIKVMVVDDEEPICSLARKVLEKRGCKVSTFLDAESAIKEAREVPYDVALVDINLPRSSGVELAEKLREEGDRPAVIIITGYPDVGTATESMRLGSRDYITKPFHPEQLVAAVKRVCRDMGLVYTNEGDLNRLIGHRIRRERQKLGLTLRQLSERTVLTTSQLSQVELGKNAASMWALARISNALGRQLSEVLRDVHNMDEIPGEPGGDDV
jgi:DNA-binding response OmpR family regulator